MASVPLFDPESPFQVIVEIDDATLRPLVIQVTNDSPDVWVMEFGHPNRAANRTFSREFAPGETFSVSLPAGVRNNVVWGDMGPYRYSSGPR